MPLVLHQRPIYKPARYRRADLSHPHLCHSVGVWYMLEGAGPVINEVNQRPAELVGNVKWSNGLLGLGVDWANASSGFDRIDIGPIQANDPINCSSTQELTIIVCVQTPSVFTNSFPRLFDKSNGGSGADGYAFTMEGGDRLEFYVDGSRSWAPVPITLTDLPAVFAVSFRRSDLRPYFYLDGEDLGFNGGISTMLPDTVTNAAIGNWNHSATDRSFGGSIHGVLLKNKALDPETIRNISRSFWAPLVVPVFVFEPSDIAAPVNIDIQNLRHARSVDDVDVVNIATNLLIDGLQHARGVDDIPALGVLVDLFFASLRHARPVDDLELIVSVDLGIEVLAHRRRVDGVDLQELVGVVIDIDDARHGRPVDALLLDVEQSILIDGLRHGRPVDAVDAQFLMGAQTGVGATSAAWVLDAGQSLNNATSIDFGYHVLEGVFDGNQSVLGVDGARVTGAAGMRELTVLTLGADVDGQRRMQGEIAELRIYAGALSQADRDRITQELTAKWITG